MRASALAPEIAGFKDRSVSRLGPSHGSQRGRGSVRLKPAWACQSHVPSIAGDKTIEDGFAGGGSRAEGIVSWARRPPAEHSRRAARPADLPPKSRMRNFAARNTLKAIDSAKLSRLTNRAVFSAESLAGCGRRLRHAPSARRARPSPPTGRPQKSTTEIFRLATH
jgi:hypothetical protein